VSKDLSSIKEIKMCVESEYLKCVGILRECSKKLKDHRHMLELPIEVKDGLALIEEGVEKVERNLSVDIK
jgi:hypothetical protein